LCVYSIGLWFTIQCYSGDRMLAECQDAIGGALIMRNYSTDRTAHFLTCFQPNVTKSLGVGGMAETEQQRS
jgi:hypothetical protein